MGYYKLKLYCYITCNYYNINIDFSMKENGQSSLKNQIIGLKLDTVNITDQYKKKYFQEKGIKTIVGIEKLQEQCKASNIRLEHTTKQIQQRQQQIDSQSQIKQFNDRIPRRQNQKKQNQIQNSELWLSKNKQITFQKLSNYLKAIIFIVFVVMCFGFFSFSNNFQKTNQRIASQVSQQTDHNLSDKVGRFEKTNNSISQQPVDNIKIKDDLVEQNRQRGLQQKLLQAAQQDKDNGPASSWSDLHEIQNLWLGRAQLEELPEKLCALTQLKVLGLWQNQLSSLPENIGALKELQTLNLFNNQLTKLPQSLGNLRELTWLSLRDNQLTELPQSLGNLSKVRKLVIYNNPNLKQLPKSFKNLKELNDLLIDWQLLPKQNIFKTEPFASLKNLQKLYIWNDDRNEQRREATKKEGSQMKVQVYYWINYEWQ